MGSHVDHEVKVAHLKWDIERHEKIMPQVPQKAFVEDLFHAACHIIDGYFAWLNMHPVDREERERAICILSQMNDAFTKVWQDYTPLWDARCSCRAGKTLSGSDIQTLRQNLLNVQTWVNRLPI